MIQHPTNKELWCQDISLEQFAMLGIISNPVYNGDANLVSEAINRIIDLQSQVQRDAHFLIGNNFHSFIVEYSIVFWERIVNFNPSEQKDISRYIVDFISPEKILTMNSEVAFYDPLNIKGTDLPINGDSNARQRQYQLSVKLQNAAPDADSYIVQGLVENFENINRREGDPDLYFPYRIDDMWAIGFGTVLYNPPKSVGNMFLVAAFSSGITAQQAVELAVPKSLKKDSRATGIVIKSLLNTVASVGLKYTACECYWFDLFGHKRIGKLETIRVLQPIHDYGPLWNVVALVEADDGTLHSVPCTTEKKVTLPKDWHEQTGGFHLLVTQPLDPIIEDNVWNAIKSCFCVEESVETL